MTWATIKTVLKQNKNKHSFPHVFRINDKEEIDRVTVAQKFNDFFTKIGKDLPQTIKIPEHFTFKSVLKDSCRIKFSFQPVN